MKIIIALLIGMITTITADETFYQFKLKNLAGDEVALSDYEGKVVLVVNVASKCSFTSQYDGLQTIYEKYSAQGFVILGFPANNFKGQEPGSDEEIRQFCTLEYGVEFPMFSKVSVKGDDQAPLFAYLTSQPNPDFDGEINWNFEKFLIDKQGVLQRRFRGNVKPESKDLVQSLQKHLAKNI